MNSPTELECLERQAFDEAAFGRPFFRVVGNNTAGLQRDMAALRSGETAFIVDAKVASEDLATSRVLQSLGFRKICVQVRLVNDLRDTQVSDSAAQLEDRVDWPSSVIAAHARNFVSDRFAQDVLLPAEGHDRLFSSWIENSLSGERRRVLHIGYNFVTFRDDGDGITIDLLSVLDRHQGIGTRLLHCLVAFARERGLRQITTVTESENRAALRAYRATGFDISDFQTVLHCVAA